MSVETHRAELVDQSLPMPRRFRALFTLRSIGGDDAIAALLGSLEDPSALFRHEVAFALGQMQAPGAVETLKRVLRDTGCLLYTSPSPRDRTRSRMPSSA